MNNSRQWVSLFVAQPALQLTLPRVLLSNPPTRASTGRTRPKRLPRRQAFESSEARRKLYEFASHSNQPLFKSFALRAVQLDVLTAIEAQVTAQPALL
jgi:hypothetical protein